VKIGLSREYFKRSEAFYLGTTGQMSIPIDPVSNGRSQIRRKKPERTPTEIRMDLSQWLSNVSRTGVQISSPLPI
jgi:hypothetical protein